MKKVLILSIAFLGCSYAKEPDKEKDAPQTRGSSHFTETVMEEKPEVVEVVVEEETNRYALIIANGNYKPETRWGNISSHNDIPIIKTALLKKGFPEKNITVIKDADYATMKKSLADFKAQLKAGDVAVIHYSGHGQQIMDNDGDEPDGYDEALVPVDAYVYFQKGVYEGERHMRDDEFGQIVKDIRKQLTASGNLLVVIDACHSGTTTRGFAKARGTMQPFEYDGYKAKIGSDNSAFGFAEDEKDLATFVGFFGASPHQLNYEYSISADSSVGSLSYAFSKALIEAEPNYTYEAVFDNIRREMSSIAPNQNPTSEGTLNQDILGGKIRGRSLHFNVGEYQEAKGVAYITLSSGALSGLYKESVIGLYAKNVEDPAKAEAKVTGKIISSKPLTAIVKLDKPISEQEALNSWAFIKEQSFGDLGVRVKLDLDNKGLQNKLISSISKSKEIKLVEESPDLVIESNNKYTRGNQVQIIQTNDNQQTPIWTETSAKVEADEDDAAGDILQIINDYGRTKYIRSLETEDPKLKASFELIPYDATVIGDEVIDATKISLEEKKNDMGQVTFKEGDLFKLKVTNNGTRSIFFTLLDLSPDGSLAVVIPQGNNSPEDYRLEPGKSVETEFLMINAPFGNEVFKLVSSSQPIDLRPIATNRGSVGKRGSENPFESLFADTFKDKSTRGTTTLPSGSVSIYTDTFIIESRD